MFGDRSTLLMFLDDTHLSTLSVLCSELVDGPFAVKMLAPKNREFPLEFGDIMKTSYSQVEATETQCPAMSLTLDLMSNSTIRGLVGIFKRNMNRITVDFACIIDPNEENEPTCILGLWRMDHLVAESFPPLADRCIAESNALAEDDVDLVRAGDHLDSIRGSMLVKRLSQSIAMQQAAKMVEISSVA